MLLTLLINQSITQTAIIHLCVRVKINACSPPQILQWSWCVN